MRTGKQIRILLSIAVLFCALIVGFNLFFVKEPAETIVLTDYTEKDAEVSAFVEENGKININTATAAELEKLDRIGPTLAQRIVEYRKTTGKFRTIEEIQNVSGIGPTIYEEIKGQIEVE